MTRRRSTRRCSSSGCAVAIPALDRHLHTYLFTEGSITEIEHEAEHDE